MVIFRTKHKKLDEIVSLLLGYINGQIIHRNSDAEYYQAHIIDVLPDDSKERTVILKVGGYCKLAYKDDSEHSCTIVSGTQIETSPKSMKFKVQYAQLQKAKTPKERLRVYCRIDGGGNEDVYLIKSNHPLSLTYDNTTLAHGPTQIEFKRQMREGNLKKS